MALGLAAGMPGESIVPRYDISEILDASEQFWRAHKKEGRTSSFEGRSYIFRCVLNLLCSTPSVHPPSSVLE